MTRAGALALAWALGVYAALGGLPTQASHELHLSLAHHALEAPTRLGSVRWNGGQSMAGHPPLLHHAVAALARVPGVGLERAYAGVMALLPMLLTFALGLLVDRAASRRAGHVAAWLCAAHPLLFQYAFPYGQGPFTLGVALALAAGACWATSTWRGLVAGCALGASAVFAHAAAVTMLGVAGALALSAQTSWGRRAAVVASAGVAGVIAVWVLTPFIEAMHGGVATPGSKLLAPRSGVGAAVLGVALWASVVAIGVGGRTGRIVGASTLAFAALSLTGGPGGIAADKWVWLAALGTSMCWACASESSDREVVVRGLVTGAVALSLVTTAWLLGRDDTRYGTRNRALREARAVLERPEAARFRYLTVGVGTERFELARYVWARSADTGVPWLPAQPLRGTQFLSIDELPVATPAGLEAFAHVLGQAPALHVKWVLSQSSAVNSALEKAGFGLRAAWKGELTLWERDATEPMAPTDGERTAPPAWPWAVAPLASLGVGVLLGPWRTRRVPGAHDTAPTT